MNFSLQIKSFWRIRQIKEGKEDGEDVLVEAIQVVGGVNYHLYNSQR